MTVRGATWYGTSIFAWSARARAQVPKWAWVHKSHSYLEITAYGICILE